MDLGKIYYRNVETHSAHVVCDYFSSASRVLDGARRAIHIESFRIFPSRWCDTCASAFVSPVLQCSRACMLRESRIRMVKLVAVVSSGEHEGNGVVSRSFIHSYVCVCSCAHNGEAYKIHESA